MQTLYREALLEAVAQSLDKSHADDLPAIRQTMNDTADAYRRNHYSVRDFAQDKFVRDVQARLRAR